LGAAEHELPELAQRIGRRRRRGGASPGLGARGFARRRLRRKRRAQHREIERRRFARAEKTPGAQLKGLVHADPLAEEGEEPVKHASTPSPRRGLRRRVRPPDGPKGRCNGGVRGFGAGGLFSYARQPPNPSLMGGWAYRSPAPI